MEFTKVVAERYSCKNFSTRKVEAEKLTEILEAGRLAPTAKNSQEQRIYVLQSEESLAKLDKVTPCRYGAPTCLVVAFDKNSVFTYPGGKRDSGVEDASIVATPFCFKNPASAPWPLPLVSTTAVLRIIPPETSYSLNCALWPKCWKICPLS